MRVQVTPERVELVENIPFAVQISVHNTGEIIGGYTLRVLGADPSWVRLDSDTLSLFPDTTQTVTALFTVPKGLGAGDRRIAIQVRELTAPGAIAVVEIELVVPVRQAVKMALTPMTVIAGKAGKFGVVIENTGNTPIDVRPIGLDPEEQLKFEFDPPVVPLVPGEHVVADLRASAKRRWFGAPVVRTFSLSLPSEQLAPPAANGVPLPGVPATGIAVPPPAPPEPLATGTLMQKPRLGRGAISLLSLLLAVTVFAVVITIALSRLVSNSAADRDLAIQVAAARQSTAVAGSSQMSGQVKLLATGAPAGSVAVDVFTASALGSPLLSTATDAKGNWTVPNLQDGSYKIRFRAAGFSEIWYPSATDATDAQAINLQIGQKMAGLGVALGGLPATVTGKVVGDDVAGAIMTISVPAGDLPRDGAPVTSTASSGPTPLTTITGPGQGSTTASSSGTGTTGATQTPAQAPRPAAATTGAATGANGSTGGGTASGVATPGAVVQTVPIGSDGAFEVDQLPSPAVYQLTVSKGGYATATQEIDLTGGEKRQGIELRLIKGDGLITGTVMGPDGPLGNAIVTATTGTSTVQTVSLTTGKIGSFTLRGLVTPGTYTVQVSLDNYTPQSATLTLTAGEKLQGVQIALTKASGQINGLVTTLADNKPAAGVTVTVSTGGSLAGSSATTTGTSSSSGNSANGGDQRQHRHRHPVDRKDRFLDGHRSAHPGELHGDVLAGGPAVANGGGLVGRQRRGVRGGHHGDRRHHRRDEVGDRVVDRNGHATVECRLGQQGRRGRHHAELRIEDVHRRKRLAAGRPLGAVPDHRNRAGYVHPLGQSRRHQPDDGHPDFHRGPGDDLRPGTHSAGLDQRHHHRSERRVGGRTADPALSERPVPGAGLQDDHHRLVGQVLVPRRRRSPGLRRRGSQHDERPARLADTGPAGQPTRDSRHHCRRRAIHRQLRPSRRPKTAGSPTTTSTSASTAGANAATTSTSAGTATTTKANVTTSTTTTSCDPALGSCP